MKTNQITKFNIGDKVQLVARASAVDGFNYPYGKIVRIYRDQFTHKICNVVETYHEGLVPHDNDEFSK